MASMRLLVSLYMWLVWLVSGLLGIPAMVAAMALLPRRKAYAIIQRWVRLTLTASGIRVVEKGLAKFDFDKPYILMANHVNLLDPFFYALVLPIPYAGVEKKENFKLPFYGWLMGKWGNVPIDRKNLEQAKQDLRDAVAMIHREHLWMIVMPEGTRTRDGKILPFKKGGFHMALDSGLPIIPVTMNGAYEIQARGKFWARPGTVELLFHEAIDPANYSVETLDDFIRDVRAAIAGAFTGPKSELDQPTVPPLVTHGTP